MDGLDPGELRRRIVVCFSATELRDLARELGMTELAIDRGVQDAARDLVRHFEKQGGLGTLVTKLRAARPLVEWPETVHDRATPDGPAAATPAAADADAPAAAEDAAAPGPAAAAPAPDAAPANESPPAPAWIPPGHAPNAPAEAPRGIDPRILVAVSGLTLLAAIVAFVAGRASTPEGPGGAASAAPGAEASARFRPDGPAGRASQVFERSLANVARACEVKSEGAPSVDLLHSAYEQCGPPKPVARPNVPVPPPADTAEPPPEPAGPSRPAGLPDAPPPPRTNPGDDDRPPPAANGACVAGCDGSHRSCKSACGKEPTESTKYDEFQGCLSKCLKAASKCRLSCQ